MPSAALKQAGVAYESLSLIPAYDWGSSSSLFGMSFTPAIGRIKLPSEARVEHYEQGEEPQASSGLFISHERWSLCIRIFKPLAPPPPSCSSSCSLEAVSALKN